MSDLKYVILSQDMSKDTAQEFPIVFPNFLNHDDVAKAMQRVIERNKKGPAHIVSAGFCHMSMLSTFGRSETLNLESRGKSDSEIMNQYPYFHGIVTNKE